MSVTTLLTHRSEILQKPLSNPYGHSGPSQGGPSCTTPAGHQSSPPLRRVPPGLPPFRPSSRSCSWHLPCAHPPFSPGPVFIRLAGPVPELWLPPATTNSLHFFSKRLFLPCDTFHAPHVLITGRKISVKIAKCQGWGFRASDRVFA